MCPFVLSSESALKAEHFDTELSLGADGKYISGFYICMFYICVFDGHVTGRVTYLCDCSEAALGNACCLTLLTRYQ